MRLLETAHTLTPRSDWLAHRAWKARIWSNITPGKFVRFFPIGHSATRTNKITPSSSRWTISRVSTHHFKQLAEQTARRGRVEAHLLRRTDICPEFCGGQRRVCFFLILLRTSVRRATRAQVLYRQHHLHNRIHDHWYLYIRFFLPTCSMWSLRWRERHRHAASGPRGTDPACPGHPFQGQLRWLM